MKQKQTLHHHSPEENHSGVPTKIKCIPREPRLRNLNNEPDAGSLKLEQIENLVSQLLQLTRPENLNAPANDMVGLSGPGVIRTKCSPYKQESEAACPRMQPPKQERVSAAKKIVPFERVSSRKRSRSVYQKKQWEENFDRASRLDEGIPKDSLIYWGLLILTSVLGAVVFVVFLG